MSANELAKEVNDFSTILQKVMQKDSWKIEKKLRFARKLEKRLTRQLDTYHTKQNENRAKKWFHFACP